MNSSNKEKSGISEKEQSGIIKDFHLQFAQNQNHHQDLVYKFFAGFSILIVTFVYATVNQLDYLVDIKILEKSDFTKAFIDGQMIVSKDVYIAYAVFISFLFALSFGYVIQTAYIFRRDQCMVSNIRRYFGEPASFIFANYGQLKHKIFWPPDLFLFLLAIIGFFSLSITIFMIWVSPVSDNLDSRIVLLLLVPYVLKLLFYIWYYGKYHELSCLQY